MGLCKKCGAHIDAEKFCPVCGTKTAVPDIKEKVLDLKDKLVTEQSTEAITQSDIEKNKGFAVVSYIWILWIIPIFAARNSKYAKFHANQGLVLFIFSLALTVVLSIITKIPILGALFEVVAALVSLISFMLAVYGIYNAIKGRARALPLIGKIRIIK